MTPISKAQIQFIRRLQQKKYRDEHHLFVAEGEKCVSELLKTFRAPFVIASIPTSLPATHSATDIEIKQLSSLRTPQGVLAVLEMPTINPMDSDELASDKDLIIALDGVQDPGNLGTIIRTCDWFGVRHIVCSHNTADCFNPKVVQATMGALARVQVSYTELVPWLKAQACPIIGTMLDGEDVWQIAGDRLHALRAVTGDKGQRAIIVMGNEGNGITEEVRKCITRAIRIPSYPKGAETSESLNVAVATAIVLAEWRRPKKIES